MLLDSIVLLNGVRFISDTYRLVETVYDFYYFIDDLFVIFVVRIKFSLRVFACIV